MLNRLYTQLRILPLRIRAFTAATWLALDLGVEDVRVLARMAVFMGLGTAVVAWVCGNYLLVRWIVG